MKNRSSNGNSPDDCCSWTVLVESQKSAFVALMNALNCIVNYRMITTCEKRYNEYADTKNKE